MVVKMKYALMLFICSLILNATYAFCSDIYIYKLEGKNLYRTSGESKQKLRVMELIKENSTIEIGKDTIAYMTCPDCEVLKLTQEKSPFIVKMDAFKKKHSKSKIILNNFSAALRDFIYPNSKTGKLVYMTVRGSDQDICQPMVPQDYEDILFLGNYLIFKWGVESDAFIFEIRNTSNDQVVVTSKTKNSFIKIPFTKLDPGFVYQWTVVDNKKNTSCQASFSILSKQESNKIKNNLEDLAVLLPQDIDEEIKLRLQSGYLLSEGFIFDAFRFLENKGF
jgi:hypothetical protein